MDWILSFVDVVVVNVYFVNVIEKDGAVFFFVCLREKCEKKNVLEKKERKREEFCLIKGHFVLKIQFWKNLYLLVVDFVNLIASHQTRDKRS